MIFRHVIVGGTFDQLHLGHKKIFDQAFKNGQMVTIGLTQKNLYKNKKLSDFIESYQKRKNNIINYLKSNHWEKRAKFIPIVNFYGSTLTDKTIEAIVVSQETKEKAEIINQKRKKLGFKALKIMVVADFLAKDGKLLTSERIRLGEIDQEGNSYQLLILKESKKQLILPESLRPELRKPLGKVLSSVKFLNLKKSPMIISVGDIVTQKLLEVGIEPDLKIIDFRTRREKFSIFNSQFPINFQFSISKKYENRPGTVNIPTALKLKKLIRQAVLKKQKLWLVIAGEEDLLTLPAILFAPLGTIVFYGQHDRGAVRVIADEKTKKKVSRLLARFI